MGFLAFDNWVAGPDQTEIVNYNLTPLDMYNRLSQVYCYAQIRRNNPLDKYTKGQYL